LRLLRRIILMLRWGASGWKYWKSHDRKGFTYKAFNALDIPSLAWRGKGHGLARFTGAAGTADAVNVILGVRRKIEVHDERNIVNIDTAGGNISGDQNSILARFET
jgi:hypothetical protein